MDTKFNLNGAFMIKKLLSLIMPNHCICCSTIINENNVLCKDCYQDLFFITNPCQVCGHPFVLEEDYGLICPMCLSDPPVFHSARSVFVYDETSRKIILPFKHADRTDLAGKIAELMIIAGQKLIDDCDIIIPVPLHPKRLFKRKYNQAALLAKYISNKSHKVYMPTNLIRIKNTETLGHLNKSQRQNSVKNAFKLNYPDKIKGKKILIIDDVLTTSSTVSECAKVLYKNNARQVDVLTFARVSF